MEKSKLLFKTSLFKEKKYLILDIENDIEILNFEVNMLKNNPELPFLNIETRQINGGKELVYEAGSKECLLDIIEANKLSLINVIEILDGVLCNLQTINQYMLDNRKVVLDYTKIFIDSKNLMAYLIYIPIDLEDKNDASSEFRNLCISVFKEILKYKEKLTNNDKRIIDSLMNKKYDLKIAKEIINNYKINKEKESLLDRTNNKRKDNYSKQDIENQNINCNKNKEEALSNKEEHKPLNKYESVIEEDYQEFRILDNDDFDEEEEDEDLEFKEYNEIKKYEKTLNKNPKNKKILVSQLIIVMLLGSIGLIVSMEDKVVFIGIVVAMVITILIFTFLLLSENKSRK